jgi:hypothetical protein
MSKFNKTGTVKSSIPSLSFHIRITPELMEQSRAEVQRLIQVHGTKGVLEMIARQLDMGHHEMRRRKEHEQADVYWRSARALCRMTSDHMVWP